MTLKFLLPLALVSVVLAGCQQTPAPAQTTPKPTTPTTPTTPPTPVSNYVLQSVTFGVSGQPDMTVNCPGKNDTYKVDCTSNAAYFVDGKYDLGASVNNFQRVGAYRNVANEQMYNIVLNDNFGGTWTQSGNQVTLKMNALIGNFSGKGSLYLPTIFKYTAR